MSKNKKIVFVGCKDTTIECVNSLINYDVNIDMIITINEENAIRNKVSGYEDIKPFADNKKIELFIANSYSLKSEIDIEILSSFKIDLLFVIGWQRLIPEWLLNQLTIGAFGMHGSPRPLPYGRGRSPMNWSLIQGKKKFITNLFKYNPGVDDGDILSTQVFDINEFDNAKTCHYKNTLSMIKLLKSNIELLLDNDFQLRKQLDEEPTFFPKRTEEDGIIFWERDTKEIYNLIRGVTYPFPGAFTYKDDSKILIWQAQPFDSRIFADELKSGKVLHMFRNGDFIVKTGSDSLLVTEYESDVNLGKGDFLNSGKYKYISPFQYPK